jgi:hypothetical protein
MTTYCLLSRSSGHTCTGTRDAAFGTKRPPVQIRPPRPGRRPYQAEPPEPLDATPAHLNSPALALGSVLLLFDVLVDDLLGRVAAGHGEVGRGPQVSVHEVRADRPGELFA